jgi:protein SCO1/2
MEAPTAIGLSSEAEFAPLVEAIAARPDGPAQLLDLLREDHPIYDQRGTATVVRMRSWILLALARGELPEQALIFVLEELDTGVDAYLVASAARALRSYPTPQPAFAPFLVRATTNIRYHDEPVSFDGYGDYAVGSTGTSPVLELLATLAWLGPHARAILPELASLQAQRARLAKRIALELDRTVEAIRGTNVAAEQNDSACCQLPNGFGSTWPWPGGTRRGCERIEATEFEDHDGNAITFGQFFRGRPTIVVFFYTRCDNPLKCSLTIAKLARIQALLDERGLRDRVQTAAITYDPAFDLPHRLRGYGAQRGVRLDAHHRLLRATAGLDGLRRHFALGVNFVESLVNRHRLEVFVLDNAGRIAGSFERIHWDEHQVVERANEVLDEAQSWRADLRRPQPLLGTLASIGVAFFPKCPVCWAAYLSTFGIAGLERIAYVPWLQPLLVLAMLINLASLWWRGRAIGRMTGFCLATAGAATIIASTQIAGLEGAAPWGVALTFAGSLASALSVESRLPSLFSRLTDGLTSHRLRTP